MSLSSLLCLPHSNVMLRDFSSCVKLEHRNRQLHASTVGALLKVKQGVAAEGVCVSFVPLLVPRKEWTYVDIEDSD